MNFETRDLNSETGNPISGFRFEVDPQGVIHLSPGSRPTGAHPGLRSPAKMNPEGVLHDHYCVTFQVTLQHSALVPKESLVELGAILLMEPQQLLLKPFDSMVFHLPLNIRDQRGNVAGTDRKGSVPALPLKLVHSTTVFFDPLGCVAFQISNQIGNRDGSAKSTENVNVVFDSTDFDRGTPCPVEYANHVGKHPVPQCGIFQERSPILGGENDVQVNLSEGLRHRRKPIEKRRTTKVHRSKPTQRYTSSMPVDNPCRVDRRKWRPRVRFATLGWSGIPRWGEEPPASAGQSPVRCRILLT